MLMRVYLDTNIVGSFLRDLPEKIDAFKRAETMGFRYYASTEGISEFACNSDIASFERQVHMLRQLIADNCFYKQPKQLVQCDLWRLTGKRVVSLLAGPDEISQILSLTIRSHGHTGFIRDRKAYVEGNLDFFKSVKVAMNKVDTLTKDFVSSPCPFEEYWASITSSDALRKYLEEICRDLSCTLDSDQLKKLSHELSSYRATYAYILILALFLYSRLMKLQGSHRGDGVDIRHAIAGAYCDIFLTRDQRFRDLLKLGGDLWPYTVMSPEEFLMHNGILS